MTYIGLNYDLDWSEFYNIKNGTRFLNYMYDQCVALANFYTECVVGVALPVGIGSARQWWTTFENQQAFRNHFTKSKTPKAGAIVVWDGPGFDPTDGHIGVVLRVLPNGQFVTMEQNAGTGSQRWGYRHTRTQASVLGFLIPKNNPADNNSKNRKTTMGRIVYKKPQSVAPDTFVALPVKSSGSKNLVGANKEGFLCASVIVRGPVGAGFDLAIVAVTTKRTSSRTVQSTSRQHSVSGVVGPRGLAKVQVAGGFNNGPDVRTQVVVERSTSKLTVTQLSWTIL